MKTGRRGPESITPPDSWLLEEKQNMPNHATATISPTIECRQESANESAETLKSFNDALLPAAFGAVVGSSAVGLVMSSNLDLGLGPLSLALGAVVGFACVGLVFTLSRCLIAMSMGGDAPPSEPIN